MAKRHIIARIVGDRGLKGKQLMGKANYAQGEGGAYRHKDAQWVKPSHRGAQGVKLLPNCGCVK